MEMKFRHAAALALVGWYLMAPPMYSPNDVVDERAPLSQWKPINSFDTAAQCQNYMKSLQSAVSGRPPNEQVVIRKRLAKSLCVASDDPRLFQVEPLSSQSN
jgi:hypothetical protein